MSNLIEPIEKEIDGKIYILSKVPAVLGREIIIKYPISNIPKIGDYKSSEEIMQKLISYVAVPQENGIPLRLQTTDLLNNHISNALTLFKLEKEMLDYNFGFFSSGKISNFLLGLENLAMEKVTKILTTFAGKSSQAEKQP